MGVPATQSLRASASTPNLDAARMALQLPRGLSSKAAMPLIVEYISQFYIAIFDSYSILYYEINSCTFAKTWIKVLVWDLSG